MTKNNKKTFAYPTSFFQKRIWFLEKMENGRLKPHIGGVSHFRVMVHIEELTDLVRQLVRRHEICRTNFRETNNGELVQVVRDDDEIDFQVFDLREMLDSDKISRKNEIIDQEMTRAFDLENGPLFRFVFIRLQEDEQVFVVISHHIVSDAWSMSVAASELFYLVQARFYGNTELLPPLMIQYKDYAAWEQSEAGRESWYKAENYWLERLKTPLTSIELPLDYLRPRFQSYAIDQRDIILPKETKLAIEKFCAEKKVTVFNFFLAVYNILLYRLTGQTDLLVGTFVANRDLPELDGVIGPLLNSVVLRTVLDGDKTFESSLQTVQETVLGAMDNKQYPFESLLEKINPIREMNRAPLFNTSFQIFNSGGHADLKKNIFYDFTENYETFDKTLGQYDLSVHIHNRENDYLVVFVYNPDIFKKETIQRFLGYFKNLIETVLISPEKKISLLEMLSSSERKKLLDFSNKNELIIDLEKNLFTYFHEQVKKTPKNIAIYDKKKPLTYQELLQKVISISEHFVSLGIGIDSRVGVSLERSKDWVACVLALLKIGAVYVPITNRDPQERKRYICSDASLAWIICEDDKSVFCDTAVVIKRSQIDTLPLRDEKNAITAPGSKRLAMIIYTSGSTGKPKGVMLSHQGVANHAFAKVKLFNINENDRLAQNLSAGFVASLWQVFSPLFVGAQFVIYDSELIALSDALFLRLGSDRVTLWVTSPLMFKRFIDLKLPEKSFSPNLKIALTGEDTPDYLAEIFYQYYNFPLYNIYGQTECSDDTLGYLIPKNGKREFLLGRPLANVQVYILDDKNNLCPFNVPGEIAISGVCVALGYLNQAEKSDAVFLPHPFLPGEKIFKTGDLGRLREDGNFEYLGRLDKQIKVFGERIDLREIESLLLKNSDIVDCLAILCSGEICLYFVAKKTINLGDIYYYLSEHLPKAALPKYFIKLLKMPLNSHGKIDRSALPQPGSKDRLQLPYAQVKNQQEEILAIAWQEILKKNKVSRFDDFFVSGGHSLKAAELVNNLRQKGYSLSLSDVFRFSRLLDQAKKIHKNKHVGKNGQKPLTVFGDFFRQQGEMKFSMKSFTWRNLEIKTSIFRRAIERCHKLMGDKKLPSLSLKKNKEKYDFHFEKSDSNLNPLEIAKLLLLFQKSYNLESAKVEVDNFYVPFCSYPEYYHCLHANILELIYHNTGNILPLNLAPAFDYFLLPNYFVYSKIGRADADFIGTWLGEDTQFAAAKKFELNLKFKSFQNEESAKNHLYSENKALLLLGNNYYLPGSPYYHDNKFISSINEERNLLPVNFSTFQSIDEKIFVSSANLNFFGEITQDDFWGYWRNFQDFDLSKQNPTRLFAQPFCYLEFVPLASPILVTPDLYYEALVKNVSEYFKARSLSGKEKQGFSRAYFGQAALVNFRKDIMESLNSKTERAPDIVLVDMWRRLQKSRLFLHSFLQEIVQFNDDFNSEATELAQIIKRSDAEFARLYNLVKEHKIDYEPLQTFLPSRKSWQKLFLSQNDKKKMLKEFISLEKSQNDLFLSLNKKLNKLL